MDALIKIMAVISGLLALIKGAFDIIREYRENAEALSGLWARPRFRIAAILTILGIIIIAAGLWFAVQQQDYTVTVQIWNVTHDQKQSVFASKSFPVSHRGRLAEQIYLDVSKWIIRQIRQTHNQSEPSSIGIDIYIPANLSDEKISVKTTPKTHLEMFLYIIQGSAKARARTRLNEHDLENLGKDFYIELNKTGYSPALIKVKWGEALSRHLTLTPNLIRIGIERFSGKDNLFAEKLTELLSAESRFQIMNPATLTALRKEIRDNRNIIASQPMVQMKLRTSLGLDFIISGTYQHE
ncbi:MAG: hypothetical protein JRJ04_17350 [Deltaproteobacteria bacterium]|nr:hypothetical protein [Deltaproteobacteria bacterium]